MNSEVIRKLALQQIQEEEQKKKEEEIKLAVALEVERLRSRPSTELVKDDLSELKNEILELKRKVSYLEIQLNNNPLDRKVMELANYMGDTTLAFRSSFGLTKRKFRANYRVLNNNSNNNWNNDFMVGGTNFCLSIDYSKRVFQIITHTNNENRKMIEYSFKDCNIDPYDESRDYEFTVEVSTENVHIYIGDISFKRDLSSLYRTGYLFENGFIVLYKDRFGGCGLKEYY